MKWSNEKTSHTKAKADQVSASGFKFRLAIAVQLIHIFAPGWILCCSTLMLTNKTLTTSCLINELKVGGCNFLLVCIQGWLMPNSLPSSALSYVCKCEHILTHIRSSSLLMGFLSGVFWLSSWEAEETRKVKECGERLTNVSNVFHLPRDLCSLVNESVTTEIL